MKQEIAINKQLDDSLRTGPHAAWWAVNKDADNAAEVHDGMARWLEDAVSGSMALDGLVDLAVAYFSSRYVAVTKPDDTGAYFFDSTRMGALGIPEDFDEIQQWVSDCVSGQYAGTEYEDPGYFFVPDPEVSGGYLVLRQAMGGRIIYNQQGHPVRILVDDLIAAYQEAVGDQAVA